MNTGAYLRVWDSNGACVDVVPDDEPRIDSAVQQFIDSAGTRNTILDLTMTNGSTYRTLASGIGSWMLSTPETRLRQTELEKALKDEDRENRAAVGLPWEEA